VYHRPDEGGDDITDFKSGTDHIVLNFGVSASSVNFVGFKGPDDTPDSDPTLIYSDVSGELLWDATGGDATDAVLIATLDGSPELARSDILLT